MRDEFSIKTALISVYDKNGLEDLVHLLNQHQVKIYSTGGTEKFIKDLKVPVFPVEELTEYPSILGGRVKTLHPKVFGGILARREEDLDLQELALYQIPTIDLVIVNLYPFQATVESGASDEEIIEKIDIGGISLIRAGGKNFKDVCIIPSPKEYTFLKNILENQNGKTTLAQRRDLARRAFEVSSTYDKQILDYFKPDDFAPELESLALGDKSELRYGENPHQKGYFHGNFSDLFEKKHGKELSYNNLVDLDAGIHLIAEFQEPTFAILKHNNPCGVASRPSILQAWKDALAGDPVSAFGGVLISNREIDLETAEQINLLFFEVLVSPGFHPNALPVLQEKKNRILLVQKPENLPKLHYKSLLNGVISQEMDQSMEDPKNWNQVTHKKLNEREIQDLLFSLKVVKHTKSNAIVLSRDNQMIGIGLGQTSRVDALNQAIAKAIHFGFPVEGSVMASDAFFPFPDCVKIASEFGIKAIVQPGGSIKDQDSIEACNELGIAMALTSVRHFKH